MAGILLGVAEYAIFAASAMSLFQFGVRPVLLRERARRPAFWLTGALAWSIPGGFLLAVFVSVPFTALYVVLLGLGAAWLFPSVLIRLTGGALPR